MRCFIAIDAVTPRLIEVANQVRELLSGANVRASYQDPHTLHVTIKFLGEVDEGRVEVVKEMLNRVRHRRFEIEVEGFGGFPNLRSPRVIFFDVKDSPDLNEIFSQVEELMSRCGFPREARRFKPHITIARVKTPLSIPTKVYNQLVSMEVREVIRVDKLKLKESILRPTGAVYRDIHVVDLLEE